MSYVVPLIAQAMYCIGGTNDLHILTIQDNEWQKAQRSTSATPDLPYAYDVGQFLIDAMGLLPYLRLEFERTPEIFSKNDAVCRKSAAVTLVLTLAMTDREQAYNFHPIRRPHGFPHLAVFEALHQCRVVPEGFSHQHHRSQRDHHLAV